MMIRSLHWPLGPLLAGLFACVVQAEEVDWKAGVLGHLSPLIGTYGVGQVLDDPVVVAAVAHLVPEEARADIALNLQVAGPVDFISGYLVLSGNAPHAGGEDEAYVWLKVYDGSAIVVLTRDGARTLYADTDRYSYLPKVLRAQLATRPGDMLAKAPASLRWDGRE